VRLAEQALLLLIQRLNELLLFVEPDVATLSTFSHKARELLLLACTECENYWQDYLRDANALPLNGRLFTTNDYVKLLGPLHLAEFEILMHGIALSPPFVHFLDGLNQIRLNPCHGTSTTTKSSMTERLILHQQRF
jgi:hypothetical protein